MKVFLIVYSIFALTFANAQDYSILENQFKTSSILPNIHYGFCLYDLEKNEQVFAFRDNQYFTPASNTKVYTLYSSLINLGDSIPGLDYIIRGDSLIFWGTGDPTFLHPKLDNQSVYNFLKNSDKKLYYVKQESSEPVYRNGWSIEDFQEYYQPDIAAFPIYGNLVRFYIENNDLKTLPSHFDSFVKATNKEIKSFDILRSPYSNNFEFTTDKLPTRYTSNKPFIWSDSLFVDLLQDTLKKDVSILTNYRKPQDTKIVYSVRRDELLREMMLPSDNFLAEQLTMLISSNKYDGFYTDSLRRYMQREYYSQFQDSVILRDGSGLSSYNKITPRNMVDLLVTIDKLVNNEDIRNSYFPMGGIDGTLKSVYELDLSAPFVWAKTGTINSVHCQSGYLETREGRRFAYSFLNNNFTVPTSVIRKEMVRIMTFIRQNY